MNISDDRSREEPLPLLFVTEGHHWGLNLTCGGFSEIPSTFQSRANHGPATAAMYHWASSPSQFLARSMCYCILAAKVEFMQNATSIHRRKEKHNQDSPADGYIWLARKIQDRGCWPCQRTLGWVLTVWFATNAGNGCSPTYATPHVGNKMGNGESFWLVATLGAWF